MEKHKLIDCHGQRLARFCFCSDGPYDIRDFVVKQCFMSKARLGRRRARALALTRAAADLHARVARLGRHGRAPGRGRVARLRHRGFRRAPSGASPAGTAPISLLDAVCADRSQSCAAQNGLFPRPRRMALSIPRQLHALGLEPFEGRQHSGIDVSGVRARPRRP